MWLWTCSLTCDVVLGIMRSTALVLVSAVWCDLGQLFWFRIYDVSLLVALFSRVCFFFFKQKTAYERRISDWSSDVCSSDLARRSPPDPRRRLRHGAPSATASRRAAARRPRRHSRHSRGNYGRPTGAGRDRRASSFSRKDRRPLFHKGVDRLAIVRGFVDDRLIGRAELENVAHPAVLRLAQQSLGKAQRAQIGRASCRERVGQYV